MNLFHPARAIPSRRVAWCSVVLIEHGEDALVSVFDADRLLEEGAACLLQIFSELGRIGGEVEWCAQVHDGGFQDIPLWRRRILLWQRWTFERRACGARRATATIFL
jgi:hypothetical protein